MSKKLQSSRTRRLSENGGENYKVAKFTASDAAPNDYFGASVVIGADLDDGAGGIDSGSVYIYEPVDLMPFRPISSLNQKIFSSGKRGTRLRDISYARRPDRTKMGCW